MSDPRDWWTFDPNVRPITGTYEPPVPDPLGIWKARGCDDQLGTARPCRFGCGALARQAWWKGRIEIHLDVEGPVDPNTVSHDWMAWFWDDGAGLIERNRLNSDRHAAAGLPLYVTHPCEDRRYRYDPQAAPPPQPPAPPPPTERAPARMSTPENDPFAGGDKLPAVSFKNAPHGTVVKLEVTAAPKMVQARDYDTNEPAFWKDGNPKQTVVTEGTVDGVPMSLWAAKPSSMFAAIAEAQRAAGEAVKAGGTLMVELYDTKPVEPGSKKEGQKLYRAHYTPPVSNAFGDNAPAAAPAQQAAPAAAAPAGGTTPPPWGNK